MGVGQATEAYGSHHVAASPQVPHGTAAWPKSPTANTSCSTTKAQAAGGSKPPGQLPSFLAHLTQVKNHSRQYKQVPVSGAGTHLSGGYRGGTGQWLADPGFQG